MKVTEELFKTIKKTKVAPAKLSDRTVKNIFKCANYAEYRAKYCVKKSKKEESDLGGLLSQLELHIMNDITDYYFLIKNQYKNLNRLMLINIIVTAVGLAVLIGLIAW